MVISSLLFIASTLWSAELVFLQTPRSPVPSAERVNFAALGDGSVVGILELRKPWRDYRDREVPPGTYVLRYAIQPRLKDHAGTSAYRDFLLLEPSTGTHPFVMALVPLPSKRTDQRVIESKIRGIRVGIVIEGTGELGM
jgi:hypothetical protein